MSLEMFPPPSEQETAPECGVDTWLRDRSIKLLRKKWPAPYKDSYINIYSHHANHPWLNRMTGRDFENFNILGGRGFFHSWGPNYTADAIVIRETEILLVKRRDTGDWALPGGFIEPGENNAQAARRECHEETGIHIPAAVRGQTIYQGPVGDVRMLRQAWPETSAVLFTLPQTFNAMPVGSDDAVRAAWFPIEIARSSQLYGSHQLLVALAAQAIERI